MLKFLRSILLCIGFIAQFYTHANTLREILNEKEALKLYEICQKINSKDKLTPAQLLFHNDRDIFDCSGTYCLCKELSERPISRREEKEAIEAIKCILYRFDMTLPIIPSLYQEKFNPIVFIEKIDKIVLHTKFNNSCIIF